MIEQLDPKQLAIINKAARLIRKARRDEFRAYVLDIVRSQREPTDTSIRHACGSGLVRYGRKI